MLLNIPLEESLALVKRSGHATAQDLINALRSRGVKTASRCVPSHKGLPANCLVAIKVVGSKRKHWVLNFDGALVDPGMKWRDGGYVIVGYIKIG